MPPAERQRIVFAEQKKWDDQRKAVQRKIAAFDRKNAAKFNEVAGQMFRRLAHEAFHAYLENLRLSAANARRAALAERRAGANVRGRTARGRYAAIDTPNLVALASLAKRPAEPPAARAGRFAERRQRDVSGGACRRRPEASRSYYYSWGLAYYLAFDQGVFGTPAVRRLSESGRGNVRVERFETLVGMPLDAVSNALARSDARALSRRPERRPCLTASLAWPAQSLPMPSIASSSRWR